MERSDIVAKLVALGRDVFDEEDLSFDEDTRFDQIEEWDSSNHVHMVVAMEKAFAIRFVLSELQRLVYVRDLVDIIERRRAGS